MAHSRGILFLDLYLLDLELKIQADRKSHRVHTTTTVTPEPLLPAEGEEAQPAGEEFPQEMSPRSRNRRRKTWTARTAPTCRPGLGSPRRRRGHPTQQGWAPSTCVSRDHVEWNPTPAEVTRSPPRSGGREGPLGKLDSYVYLHLAEATRPGGMGPPSLSRRGLRQVASTLSVPPCSRCALG